MNTKQEHIYYWCRGSKENPDGVIKALTEKGAEHNYKAIKGKDEELLYYINLNNEVKCCRINSEHADLIMRCGEELQPVEKPKRWRDDKTASFEGYYIQSDIPKIMHVLCEHNIPECRHVFATKKQAKAALAMARISQIMANDERFGGVVTDEEWGDDKVCKSMIERSTDGDIVVATGGGLFFDFLSFHTKEQSDLFLEENRDLVKDFLMIGNE